MKKGIIILFITTFLFSFKSQTDGPAETVKKFVIALDNFKFNDARKIATSDALYMTDSMEGSYRVMSAEEKAKSLKEASERKYKYKLISATDTSAIVTATSESKKTGSITVKFNLVKRNGKWLVGEMSQG